MVSRTILMMLLTPILLFSQQPNARVTVDSTFYELHNSIKDQNRAIARLDSTITRLQNENAYLTKIAENNISYADTLINTLETIVEFIALLIAFFSIVGVIEIRKINKTRSRLNEELKNLFIERQSARDEIKNLKETFVQDGKELLQFLFFITEGDNCVDSNRLDEAISFYRQALKIRENNPEVYTKLGYVFVRQGEYSQAISYLEKGCNVAPPNVSILNGLARAYRKSHQLEKAEQSYKKALELDNEFIWALSGLGQIYLQKGDFDSAEVVYHRILSMDSSLYPNINLGIVYFCKKNQKKAQEFLGKALSLIEASLLRSSDGKWLLPYKVVALVGLSQYVEARKLCLQLKRSNIFHPKVLSITDRLGTLYKANEDERILEMIKIFDKTGI